MTVSLSEEEKKSPLYKYFEREIAKVPEDVLNRIMSGSFESENGLLPTEMNKLFEPGYLPGEFGWYKLKDGGIMVANLTKMPGVTPEMFDWWFAWHGLGSMRYKIWDKDDHYYCQTRNPEISLNENLSMKERYWNTTHDVKEALVDGQEPMDVCIQFVPPETIGYDPEKLKNFKGTIVCTPGPIVMSHFVRPTEDGSELRTRFWIGYDIKDNKPVRIEGFNPEDGFAKALLTHNVKEFTHLAEILPEVYNEFKDRFEL